MPSPSSDIQIFNPPSHPPLAPTYSHISITPLSPTTSLVLLAGQTGTTSPPSIPAPSFRDQVRLALLNVDKCLEAAGCTKADIVSNKQYVVRLSQLGEADRKARADVLMEWWREGGERGDGQGERGLPPDTLIGVESLYDGECLFEVEVMAVRRTG
ncbi:hypothetical protein MMC10_007303 [Thelotrema lepadinum]|nr:hypothetical protein [Thelotrema lepadinum]